jgi:hypothetical protein
MKIKLKDKGNPIKSMMCFKSRGFCQTTLDKINSGKQVEVERVPKPAWEYVEEVKTVKTKPVKAKKQNEGKSPKGE